MDDLLVQARLSDDDFNWLFNHEINDFPSYEEDLPEDFLDPALRDSSFTSGPLNSDSVSEQVGLTDELSAESGATAHNKECTYDYSFGEYGYSHEISPETQAMRRSLEQYKDGFPTYENEGILAMARNMRNGARRHPHGLEDGPGGPSGIMPISFKDQLDKDLAQANGFASDQLLDNTYLSTTNGQSDNPRASRGTMSNGWLSQVGSTPVNNHVFSFAESSGLVNSRKRGSFADLFGSINEEMLKEMGATAPVLYDPRQTPKANTVYVTPHNTLPETSSMAAQNKLSADNGRKRKASEKVGPSSNTKSLLFSDSREVGLSKPKRKYEPRKTPAKASVKTLSPKSIPQLPSPTLSESSSSVISPTANGKKISGTTEAQLDEEQQDKRINTRGRTKRGGGSAYPNEWHEFVIHAHIYTDQNWKRTADAFEQEFNVKKSDNALKVRFWQKTKLRDHALECYESFPGYPDERTKLEVQRIVNKYPCNLRSARNLPSVPFPRKKTTPALVLEAAKAAKAAKASRTKAAKGRRARRVTEAQTNLLGLTAAQTEQNGDSQMDVDEAINQNFAAGQRLRLVGAPADVGMNVDPGAPGTFNFNDVPSQTNIAVNIPGFGGLSAANNHVAAASSSVADSHVSNSNTVVGGGSRASNAVAGTSTGNSDQVQDTGLGTHQNNRNVGDGPDMQQLDLQCNECFVVNLTHSTEVKACMNQSAHPDKDHLVCDRCFGKHLAFLTRTNPELLSIFMMPSCLPCSNRVVTAFNEGRVPRDSCTCKAEFHRRHFRNWFCLECKKGWLETRHAIYQEYQKTDKGKGIVRWGDEEHSTIKTGSTCVCGNAADWERRVAVCCFCHGTKVNTSQESVRAIGSSGPLHQTRP